MQHLTIDELFWLNRYNPKFSLYIFARLSFSRCTIFVACAAFLISIKKFMIRQISYSPHKRPTGLSKTSDLKEKLFSEYCIKAKKTKAEKNIVSSAACCHEIGKFIHISQLQLKYTHHYEILSGWGRLQLNFCLQHPLTLNDSR